jgi:nucleoside-diphosphate kinase
VIVKPDGVERRLVGEIVGRLERKGLRLVAADLRMLDAATAEHHYLDHVGKPYYEALVEFITSGPVFVMIVEGPEGTWQMVRNLMGATNSSEAAPGTIRGDLGSDLRENLIHGSDSAQSAQREIAIFFPHQA